MNPRFDGIMEFVTVTRLGSFTAAAAELGITKSAVGRAVTRLEDRLGSKLLYRTTRSLALTPAGEAWLEHCTAMLAELERGENALVLARDTPCGDVRIDLPTAFGRLLVMPLLLELAECYPALFLNVSFTDRPIDLIRENVDLVVRIGKLEDTANLIGRQIGVQRMVIVGSPAYLANRGMPGSLSDLAAHDCIAGERHEHRSVWLLGEKDGLAEPYPISVKHQIRDFEMIHAAAKADRGLAQLPYWMVRDDIRDGSLKPVLGEMSGGETPVSIAWPTTRTLPAKVRVIVEELTKSLPPVMG